MPDFKEFLKNYNKTLYVNRPLLNSADIRDWARGEGFKTTLPSNDFHTTIAYSKAPVNWNNIHPMIENHHVPMGGERSIEKFGEGGEAVVLKFQCPHLTGRWGHFRDNGASWDYPTYASHITLTYNGEHLDKDKIKPYTGRLIFGPEKFAEINSNWDKNLEEEEL